MHRISDHLDYDADEPADGDDDAPPSPFDDGVPLTWRIVAWRAGLLLVLAIISLLLLLGGSFLVMWMYRQ